MSLLWRIPSRASSAARGRPAADEPSKPASPTAEFRASLPTVMRPGPFFLLAVALGGSLAQPAFGIAPRHTPACETGPAISCGCQPIGRPAQEAITGAPARWHEQLGYAYDPAGNLNYRTNNALLETFGVNSLNELSTLSRSGELTVAGTTTSPATNVTVNSLGANLYADST